jgi:hypothetical protein
MSYISSSRTIEQSDISGFSWPVTIDGGSVGTPTVVTFLGDLSLNSTNNYFVVESQYITVDGSGHTVTIDGVTGGYPGLVKSNNYSHTTIQNIHMAATNGSILSVYAGWIGQTTYGQGLSNNQFINCSNSAPINGGGGGGIIGGRSGQLGGNVTATNCSNIGNVYQGGGIFGECCGCDGGSITATNCYNSGTIVGSGGYSSSGIIGDSCGYLNGIVTIENCYNRGTVTGNNCGGIAANFATQMNSFTITNCYNSGEITNVTAAGILGAIRPDAVGPVILTNCYNSGLAANLAYGLVGLNQASPSAVTQINCASGLTWSDASANALLTGYPSTTPGFDGDTWFSRQANTPYELVSYTTTSMYSPSSIIVGGNTTFSDGLAGAAYYEIYAVNGSFTIPAGVSINPSTGRLTLTNVTPTTSGINYTNNVVSVLNYSLDVTGNIYNYSLGTLTFGFNVVEIDNTYAGSWPYKCVGSAENPLYLLFTSDLSLNSDNQYFDISGEYVTIDGDECTVTIDGVTGYPGLVKNGTSGSNGFNYTTVQNINMTATNGSSLALLAGWIGQSYFGKGASANIFHGCSNSSDVNTQGGGITGSYTGNGGSVTASYCSNSGDLYGANSTDQPGPGGIFGDYSGTSGGSVTASYCFNTGDFYGNLGFNVSWSGGIFGPRSGEGASSSAIATNCYNTGNMVGYGTENQQAGGIFGAFCGGSPWLNGGYVRAVGCYNTGNIGANSTGSGGIFGNACAYGGGQLDCSNCYNTGSINGIKSGGIIADACGLEGGTVVINNCYSVGVIYPNNNNDGIGGIFNAPSNYTNTHNYIANGAENWSDSAASAALTGVPTQIPETGSVWIALGQNTPFFLDTQISLPSPISSYSGLYPADSYSNVDPSGYVIPAGALTGSYSVIYVDDGTDPATITINSGTGSITLTASQFAPGTRKFYVLVQGATNFIGTVEYTNRFNFTITNTVLVDSTYVSSASWPVTLSTPGTLVKFASNLTLNSSSKYFVIGAQQIIIDGSGHTVTISGVTGGYPGLVKNGTSSSAGFNYTTVQNINTAATNGSSLAVLAGWLGQSYFGQGAIYNNFINCSNSARIDSGNRAGGITGAYTGYNSGNVTATNCSNTGEIIGYSMNSPGGIFGDYSGYEFGTITAIDCFNTGNISGSQPGCGGIFGSWCGSIGGNVYAIGCYNTGSIGDSGGGIFGHSCGLKNESNGQDPGYLSAYNCYNTGNMSGSSSGGIFGYHCGYYSPATIVNCYNTGTIGGSFNGGICGQECCQGGGNLTIQNCYNRGSVDTANNNGGILVDFYQDGSILNISNCYSSGVLSNPANLLYGIYSNLNVSLASINSYVASGLGNWSDASANALLTGYPSTTPGFDGDTWFSRQANTPYELASYTTTSMYSPSSIIVGGNTTSSVGLTGAAYYEIYAVNGSSTVPAGISINPSTGRLTLANVTPTTSGINNTNNVVSVLNYSLDVTGNVYNYSLGTLTFGFNVVEIDSTYAASWPIKCVSSAENPLFLLFTSDLSLNSDNQYFDISGEYVTIDGDEYTVTIDGVTGYPGLVKNSFSNVTVKNINITAVNSSTLYTSGTDGAGWIGQEYYGNSKTNNLITNCHNSAPINTGGGGGIVGTNCGKDGAVLTISYCSNSSAIFGNDANGGAGGIAGWFSGAYGTLNILNCYNTGPITGSYSGGICALQVGWGSVATNITNCYNTGLISGDKNGGITGYGIGSDGGHAYLTNCYNTGDISGTNCGGIGGQYSGAAGSVEFLNCYNAGSVSSSSAGIACGVRSDTVLFTVTNCYNSGYLAAGAGGIIIDNNRPSVYTETNCYGVNGAENWSDSAASAALTGAPSARPGLGSSWNSAAQNTPFLLAIYTVNNMYLDTSGNGSTTVVSSAGSVSGGTYVLVDKSDCKTPSSITINSATGAVTFVNSKFNTVGSRPILVMNYVSRDASGNYSGYLIGTLNYTYSSLVQTVQSGVKIGSVDLSTLYEGYPTPTTGYAPLTGIRVMTANGFVDLNQLYKPSVGGPNADLTNIKVVTTTGIRDLSQLFK